MAHARLYRIEDRERPRVRPVVREAVAERVCGARKRGAQVVERARHGVVLVLVDRAVEVAVDGFEELRGSLVRVGGVREEGAEGARQGLEALLGVGPRAFVVRPGAADAAPHFENRRDERALGRPGRYAEELDFVVRLDLRDEEVRKGLVRPRGRELAQAGQELREVLPQELTPRAEVRIREEVDALDVVVVAQGRMYAGDGGAERRGHLFVRPGEGLDAPLLAAPGIEVERLVHAVGEDYPPHRQAERLEPLVHLRHVGRGDAALRDFDGVADEVGADDLAGQDFRPALLRQRREAPEAAGEQREGRHGVVAARNRHHVAEDARLGVVPPAAQRGFRDEDDGIAVLVTPEDALLEDERVVEKVVALERAGPPPSLDGNGPRPLGGGGHRVFEK